MTWLRDNWFRLGIFLCVLFVVSMAYHYVFVDMPNRALDRASTRDSEIYLCVTNAKFIAGDSNYRQCLVNTGGPNPESTCDSLLPVGGPYYDSYRASIDDCFREYK